MEWFKPQPLPWQAGGGQALAPNPWTGQPNGGMNVPSLGPAPTWGVGPQPDMSSWPNSLGGAPNWQGMPDGMQQGQDDDPISQILEVTSTTPPDQAPDFISFMRQQDPHDVGMALALFQQSFTDPQGALQWAFQLKQSRDAQRARMEQAKVEAKVKSEQDKETKNRTRAGQLISQTNTTLRMAGIDPLEFFSANPNFDPEDPTHADAYSKWGLAKSADAKAKEQADKKKVAEQKVAVSQAVQSGVVKKGYENDPVVVGAAKLKLDREARAVAYKDMAKAREAQLAAIRGQAAKDPDRTKKAQDLHRQLSQVEGDINRYEQNIFKIQSDPFYAVLEPTDPARAGWDREIMRFKDLIDEKESAKQGLQQRWDSIFGSTEISSRAAEPLKSSSEDLGNEEDLKMLPEDVESEFVQSYMALTDPAKKERFLKFMEKKYPGYLITPPAE